jgi:uncharacterized oligopeptide transporter (OPT) family protein
MVQEMKTGNLLGANPSKVQLAGILGVVTSALLVWFPLFYLQISDLRNAASQAYPGGFGGKVLLAPHSVFAGRLGRDIIGGDLILPLIGLGMILAVVFILARVKIPLLIFVGMYLSLEVVTAIFLGSLFRTLTDVLVKRHKSNQKDQARIKRICILLAAGLMAGEALVAMFFVALFLGNLSIPKLWIRSPYVLSLLVMIVLGFLLVKVPVDVAAGSERHPPD